MEDILKIIDDATVKPYVMSTRHSSGLYPSSASIKCITPNVGPEVYGYCHRRLWYQANKYPINVEETAESIDRKDIGEWFSQSLVEKFKKVGLYVADEVPFFDDETGVSGRIDIIIKDPYTAPKPPQRPQPSQLIGIEVKSTGGYHNIKGPIISTKDTPLAPSIEHVLQVMIYLGYYAKFGLDRWILIYQDRESLRKQWHKVTLNQKGSPVITNIQQTITHHHITLDGIRERFATLRKHIADKTIPDRDYELQYSNPKIIALNNAGKLNKTDSEKVNKFLAKLAKKGIGVDHDDTPILQKGDTDCMYCPYASLCWSNDPTSKEENKILIPIKQEQKEDQLPEDLL